MKASEKLKGKILKEQEDKKFNRCFDCEWLACENHEKCLKDKIK